MLMTNVKDQVREFYDRVGWQEVGEGIYQNARYEDLRPVASEYIHRCHLRVSRHLKPSGRFLLDAGSGPIQYPEYLEYSAGYQARVCADISIVALKEARKRIGDYSEGGHGMFVVADVANLPFKMGAFDGVVSLHTIHHLPGQEHAGAYQEIYRMLAPGSSAVIVNGWESPLLMRLAHGPIRMVEWIYAQKARLSGQPVGQKKTKKNKAGKMKTGSRKGSQEGTFISKQNAGWLRQEVGTKMPLEILVWRSAGVRFLRTFFHDGKGGRRLLRLLFWLEERFPRFFGENGQYPLIVVRKP